jgi:hypothetical protein
MLTIKLPPQETQTGFNLRRWDELLADRQLAKIEGRVETDRFGHVIMSPPPAPNHGRGQSEIAHLLRTLLHRGGVLTECPISTADGVRAADVAWASAQRMKELGNRCCFPHAPEIAWKCFRRTIPTKKCARKPRCILTLAPTKCGFAESLAK